MIYKRSIKQFFKGDPTLSRYYALATTADLSGKGKNLSTVGGGAILTGSGGLFNGSGAYNISESSNYGDFTNMAWIKISPSVSAGDGFIHCIGGDANVNNFVAISFISISHPTHPGKIDYEAIFSGNYSLIGTKQVNDGRWHLIIQVRRSGNHLGYLDGKLDGSTWIPMVATSIGQDSIGYYRYNNSNYFRGWIREVAVFSRALSPAEISAYYKWVVSPKKYFVFTQPSVINTRRRLLLSM
jgi:hypothetical protein